MILDTEDYNSQIAPYMYRAFEFTFDTSKLGRLLDTVLYSPLYSDLFQTIGNVQYITEHEKNKNYGTTTTVDVIWGRYGESNLPDAMYEVYTYADVTWSKTYQVFLTAVHWSFKAYVGVDVVMSKQGKVSLPDLKVSDTKRARKAILAAAMKVRSDVQKILDTPQTHNAWLKEVAATMGAAFQLEKKRKENTTQLDLFRSAMARVACQCPSLQEDVGVVLDYAMKAAANLGDLNTFQMDKRSFLPFIEKTLRNAPGGWKSLLNPSEVDLKQLAYIVHGVLTKPSAWRVIKDWNEAELEGTILNNARNYVGLASIQTREAALTVLRDVREPKEILKILEKKMGRRSLNPIKATQGTHSETRKYWPNHLEFKVVMPLQGGEDMGGFEDLMDEAALYMRKNYPVWIGDEREVRYRGDHAYEFTCVIYLDN